MNEAQTVSPLLGLGLEPATVTRVAGAQVHVRAPAFGKISARLAVPARLQPGDSVLIATGRDGTSYVIGVLSALRELCLRDGSRAELDEEDGEQALRVWDPRGQLVFERLVDRTVVHVSEGDLEIQASGDIALRAGGEVRLEGAERTVLASRGSVRMQTDESTLELEGDHTRVQTGRLVATAEIAEAKMEEARLVIGTIRTVAGRIREQAQTVERTAEQLVERLKESFRDVEGLSATRAGSLRLVAKSTFSVLGQSALLRAKEEVKIRGEKIFLA